MKHLNLMRLVMSILLVWGLSLFSFGYSNSNGLFYPQTKMGYYVRAGEKVGFVTDYLGEVKEELVVPFSGIILYIISTPPTSRGEPLFEVGRIKQ
jgi:predicted deacylase